MKKTMVLMITVLLLAGFMASCRGETTTTTTTAAPVSSSGEDYSNETYVFMTAASNLEYFSAHKKGLQDACRALGVKASIVGDEGVDAGTMANLLAATIEQDIKGIVLVGHFPDAYTPLINSAWEKNIPVVTQTVDAPDSKRITFMGMDFVTYGANAMDLMGEALGGRGKIAISTSMASGQAAVDVLTGIQNRAAEKYPGIQIVAVLEDKAQTDTAVSVISACLQANPDLDGIIGCQATSAVAAVTAVREAGLLDKIKIVGFDRDSATLEAIKNGEIYGSMAGKQYAETYYATKFLYDFHHAALSISRDDKAAGLLGVPSFVDLGSIRITKENVDYFIGFTYDYQ
jgi:ribose transport system substrate-binding protein